MILYINGHLANLWIGIETIDYVAIEPNGNPLKIITVQNKIESFESFGYMHECHRLFREPLENILTKEVIVNRQINILHWFTYSFCHDEQSQSYDSLEIPINGFTLPIETTDTNYSKVIECAQAI